MNIIFCIGISKHYPDGERPLDFLQAACCCYAVAIKNKAKDPNLHLQLGMVLEEKYYAEDMFGLKKEVTNVEELMLSNVSSKNILLCFLVNYSHCHEISK